MNFYRWDADAVRDDLRAYVLSNLRNPAGVVGADETEAGGLADGYRSFHAKNVGVEDILRTNGNAVMLWKVHPSDTDEAAMTDCLK